MTGRRTRVLLVIDTLAVGGAERVAVDLANSLDRDTHEVLVCSTRHDGPLRAELADDVPVLLLDRRTTWEPAGIARFIRFATDHHVDVVHSHSRGSVKFVALARRLGLGPVPHVFHDHFGALHVDRRVPPSLGAAIRTGTDHYLGVDRRLCRWAIESVGLPPERVGLAVNGVDVERFAGATPVDLRTEFDLPGREVVLVMLAHFRHQKDQPTAYRALASLARAQRDRLGLVIVGRTPTDTDYAERCAAMAARLGLGDQVRVAGPRTDVPALLAGADAGLLATRNETGPVAVLEYLAAGLPFVASDTGEVTRAVRGRGVGFTPEPQDHLALAAALTELLELGARGRRAMGTRGRALAAQEFGHDRLARELAAVYRRVLAPAGNRAPLVGHTAPTDF